ncbi:MBL fold metallo-hydrolase [Streptomyces sp. NPDC059982]|uniref:MBL fold metallo-hydrolase n=1 Tax=unclassified Streptomyces TaxID=2593676 RepID=UPI0036B1B294
MPVDPTGTRPPPGPPKIDNIDPRRLRRRISPGRSANRGREGLAHDLTWMFLNPLHAPGHTPGSIGVHLPAHGVLFTGDCVAGVGQVMLGVFNVDRARALDSFRRLAALEPQVACFGHGDPWVTDTAATLRAAADAATAPTG